MQSRHPFHRSRSVVRLISLTVGILAAFLTWATLRVAWAYQVAALGGVENLSRASQLLPVEPRFRFLSARHLHGDAAEAELRRSIHLAPRNAHAWTALGVGLELAGRAAEAREAYLQAAKFDRGAAPRAMLANFSFRAGHVEDFWFWTRETADVPEARIDGLLALCERLSPDGAQTWVTVIASRSSLWWTYLGYWLGRNQFVPARAPAARLAEIANPSHTPDLLHYLDFELLFGDPEIAAARWNQLAVRRLIPYDPLSRGSAHRLTNRTLDHQPLNRGFDWRISVSHGVALTITGQTRELRIEMSGEQPPGADLFQQYLRLDPGGKYRFRFDARLTDFRRGSGLSWIIATARSPVRTLATVPVDAADWTPHQLEFICPEDSVQLRIILRYEHPPGAGRPEGVARFRSLDLTAIPGAGG